MEDSSMNTVFFGIVALAAVGVVLYIKSKSEKPANSMDVNENNNTQPKTSSLQSTQTSTESKDSMQFANEDERLRYFANKAKIEIAIADKDYERLEDMLSTRVTDFKDLKEMIEKALRDKPKDS